MSSVIYLEENPVTDESANKKQNFKAKSQNRRKIVIWASLTVKKDIEKLFRSLRQVIKIECKLAEAERCSQSSGTKTSAWNNVDKLRLAIFFVPNIVEKL